MSFKDTLLTAKSLNTGVIKETLCKLKEMITLEFLKSHLPAAE